MKKQMTTAFVFFSLLLFSSCTTILTWTYGLKKPRLETQERISRFLEKKKIEAEPSLIVEDLRSYAALSGKNVTAVPEALFFDREGRFVPYKETPQSCNAGVGVFMSSLEDLDRLARVDSISADTILQHLVDSESGRPLRFADLPRADLHVFMLWARFAGKLNKQKLWDWKEHFAAARQNGIQVHEILVNMDLQESWNLTEAEKERLRQSGARIK